jgi:hypothetical protein
MYGNNRNPSEIIALRHPVKEGQEGVVASLRIWLVVVSLISLFLSFGSARAAELTFDRAYQGQLSGQTFTTTTMLNADAGSVLFTDYEPQRTFRNTSGTLRYTVAGVPHAEAGVLVSRLPNGSTLMNAVAFRGSDGDRLLVMGNSYAASSSYGGSSNSIVAKLNEYVDATAPDPAKTTLQVNGGSTATAPVGGTASIVVTVKLGDGSPVPGAIVSLSGSPSGRSSISPASATTNASGQATFTVEGLQSGLVTYNAVASANGTTTTSSGSVSVTFVAAPPALALAAGALPDGTVGAAYGQTLTPSGGAGPYAYAVSGGALPPGLSLDASTGAITGTPTTAGSYTLDVTVTDANGATATAGYTVVIAPAALAAPVAGPVSITVAADSSANPVTLVLSGGAATSVAVAGQAGHGAATASGMSITYTPAAGFSGADSFTYTAANATGASAAATVTVTVTPPAVVAAPPALAWRRPPAPCRTARSARPTARRSPPRAALGPMPTRCPAAPCRLASASTPRPARSPARPMRRETTASRSPSPTPTAPPRQPATRW